jgi:hypothetical protein
LCSPPLLSPGKTTARSFAGQQVAHGTGKRAGAGSYNWGNAMDQYADDYDEEDCECLWQLDTCHARSMTPCQGTLPINRCRCTRRVAAVLLRPSFGILVMLASESFLE